MAIFDTNRELLIQPHRQGVQIIKPSGNQSIFPSIGGLYGLPLLVYFVYQHSVFASANHLTLLTNVPGHLGYSSEHELDGKNMHSLFDKKTADTIEKNNKFVALDNNKMTIYEEAIKRSDDIDFSGISFKFPLYNQENKIIGVFGMSVLADNPICSPAVKLSEALALIIGTGLIPSGNSHNYNKLLPGCEMFGIYLSEQEIRCLQWLIRGKTMKTIGRILEISPRTVEHYLENVKRKLQVDSKSDLVDKVVQHLWPETFE